MAMVLLTSIWGTAAIGAAEGTAEEHYRQAVAWGVRGDLLEAREALEQALQEAPFYPPALVCLETLKDVEAKKIKPQTAIHVFTAMSHGNGSRWQEYLAEINAALEIDPQYALAYNHRGNAYDELGDYDRAIADYGQALKLDPRLAAAYLNRGMAHRKKGNLDRAIADYDRALKLSPGLPQAYYIRGVAYEKKGDLARAIADFDRSVKINPEFAEAYFNKALACERAGRLDEAPAAYRRFIHNAPVDYKIQINYALERLKALEQVTRTKGTAPSN
jgi:tetratricopeptide (TPR) repeat protein